MAVSIDFLDFYSALFERSCDAVNALAAAMNNFYGRRGFQLLNRNVCIAFLPIPHARSHLLCHRMRNIVSLSVAALDTLRNG